MSLGELKHEIEEGVQFWGYERNGELIGVMGIQHIKDVTLIRHAYVRPSEQSKGIGGDLLSFLCKQATRPILIGTWADAVWAVRFYENHGFRLVSPKEILSETGLETIAVHAMACTSKTVSNDEKLIDCALVLNLPVISEDRKILLRLDRKKVPYFNALMMLNYLLYNGDISFESHSVFFKNLRSVSRYSDSVLAFSKEIYRHIVNHSECTVS
jgi:N-acetylglutamate synthase-like GNAT family acetyltransferase